MTTPSDDGFRTRQFDAGDYEPVAERFLGFRAFKINTDVTAPAPRGKFGGGVFPSRNYGTLSGVYVSSYRWGPGVNEAVCVPPVVPSWVPPTVRTQHAPPLMDCMCGFWAYTSGVHRMQVLGPLVFGMVEGWGRMVIGDKGFRAEKARIVALAFSAGHTVTESEEPRIGSWYSIAQSLISMGNTLLARHGGTTPPPPPPPPLSTSAPRWRFDEPSFRTASPDLRATVARLYPDAQVFDTVAAMQAEFPPSDTSALLRDQDGGAA